MPGTTVENINIEVKTNAGDAAKQFSSLSDAIRGVEGASKAAGGVGDVVASSVKRARKETEPLSAELQSAIKNATKYEVLVNKAATAEVKMNKAFRSGNETAAWQARERNINATVAAAKELEKSQPKIAPTPVSADLRSVIETATQIDVLQAKLESLRSAMQEAFESGNVDKAYSLRSQILQTESALERATEAANKNAEATKTVGDEAEKATPKISKLFSSIKRIAMYRMLRTILKNITQAFNEGLKNAYAFSKGIDGTLAKALDGLATKSLTMKNQLGAALGNLLTAITPILLQIINLATIAAQALSALFSALGGGQYLVAKDTATAWDKATGAAQKYKNTILGFDEINRLNDENSGGGGGADPTGMFDVGELPAWAQWLKDHLEQIKKLAEAIALALAAWTIAKLLNDLLGLGLTMQQLLGIAMAVAGAFLLIDGFLDAWKNGASFDNINEMLIGTALLAGGLALAFGSVAGAIGLLIGGIALLVIGFRDWIKKGELTDAALYAIEGGLLAVGAAISVLTGSWIPLLIAGLAGLVLALATRNDEILFAVDGFFATIIPKIDGFLQEIERLTGLDLTSLRRTVMFTLNYIRFDIEALVLRIGWMVEDLGRVVKAVKDGDWEEAWNGMQMLAHDASLDVTADVAGMAAAVTEDMMNGTESTQDLGQAFKDLLIDVRNNVPDATTEFSNFTDEVVDGSEKAMTPLQKFLDKFTDILSVVQKISGISVSGGLLGLLSGNGWSFSVKETLGLPTFASGGSLTNDGTLFMAGEAGTEVVADMGSRTGVMNVDQMEAAVANGNIGVINAVYQMANMIVKAVNEIDPDITLDGESMANAMYKYNKQAANRHGAAMVT